MVYPLNPGTVTPHPITPGPGETVGLVARELQSFEKHDATHDAHADYGAVGDGMTDDTAALQAWLDALPDNSIGVLPPRVFKSGALVLADKSNVVLRMGGAKINWTGTGTAPAGYVGLCLSGTLTHVTVEGGWLHGDADVASCHAGVWTDQDAVLTNVTVRGVAVSDTVIGIQIGSSVGSTDTGCLVTGCWVENIVGLESGHGYGINFSAGATGTHRRIIGNHVEKAQRHSIYVGVGSNIVVANNVIKDHRLGVATGDGREAISASRIQHAVIVANILDNCQDGGIRIEPDVSAGQNIRGILVANNLFRNCVPYGMWLGSQVVVDNNPTESVTVRGNMFSKDAAYASTSWTGVIFRTGSRIAVTDNLFYAFDSTAQDWAIEVACDGETALTATYSGPLEFSRNAFSGSGSGNQWHGFYLDVAFVASAVHCRFVDNQYDGPDVMFQCGDVITNPNIIVGGQETTGMTLSGVDITYPIGAGMTHYTPTVGGTGWAVGNGSANGYYTIIDGFVTIEVDVVWGSTSTFGSGALEVGLPSPAVAGFPLAAIRGTANDVGSNFYDFLCEPVGATVQCFLVGTTGAWGGAVDSTHPFTWTAGDHLYISGAYRT